MIFFGPAGVSWGERVADGAEMIPPPYGAQCVSCEDWITPTDTGALVPHISEGNDVDDVTVYGKNRRLISGREYAYKLVVWHRRCFLQALGARPEGPA